MATKIRATSYLPLIHRHLHAALGWRTIPFIAACLLLVPAYRRKFSRPDDDVAKIETKKALTLLGVFHGRLARLVGQEEARRIMTDLVTDVAVTEQRGWYIPKAGEPRSWDLLHAAHEHQMAHGLIRFNEKTDLIREPDLYHYHTTRCVFHEAFGDMGIPWLTEPFCKSDEVVFNEYLPEMRFHRGEHAANTIARGAKQCEFIFQKGTPRRVHA